MSGERTLYGFHAVAARLRQHAASIRTLYLSSSRRDPRMRDLAARARGAGCEVRMADGAELDRLANSADHQGVVALVEATPLPATLDDVLAAANEPPLLLVLDGVTDPHNLGACLRNADAFGAHAVIVPKDRAVQ